MAYNLESLITILEQILNPQQTRWIFLDQSKPQLQSLFQTAASLKQIHENPSLPKVESLETKIREATHKAEDIIESYMVDQMLSNPGGVSFAFSPPDVQQVTQELDSIMEQVVKLMEGKTMSSGSGNGSSLTAASSSSDLTSKRIVVGLDEDLLMLKDRLTGMRRKLEVVPIVGMGGIGKTTLARKLYQDPLVVEHFTSLAWTTISQDYDMQTTISKDYYMRTVLLGLLRCIIGKHLDPHVEKKNDELKIILYKSLYGRRYLIVLDDVWSTKFWDDMRNYFPDNNNGSRIVLTTRESDVAKDVNSQSEQHKMHLLDESESWDLLQKEVFGEEKCPAELEGIGRNIARNCGGLPLAIHVTAGLLSKADRTQQFWQTVANDVGSAVGGKDEFSNIFSLSYNHLPSHLKPCFLYFGAFPEDYEIKSSRLIRLWIAEGFLKPNGDKSLEEEAEDCLTALVGRNLVSVRTVKSNGRAKGYGIHDLLRDLCLKNAEQQRLVEVKNKRVRVGNIEQDSMHSIRRVSVHPSFGARDIYASTEFMSSTRSFLCTGVVPRAILSDVVFGLRLLRVLDIFDIEFHQFPKEILRLVNLRYLAFSYTSFSYNLVLPSEISRLRNLQTLVLVSRSMTLPPEIWDMTELRHIKIYPGNVYTETRDWRGFMQEKLKTIFSIYEPSGDFLKGVPNLTNLGIVTFDLSFDLEHLLKLETLKFSYSSRTGPVSSRELTLPSSLRKLSLTKCDILAEFIKYLCELPNLEVLKIQYCEFESGKWDATEQVFQRLQFLQLERLRLVHWEADETNFPRLRHLVIRGCSALEEIPSGIGDIPTLQTIELDECSPSLFASAQFIIQEQRDLANYDLQLRT